MRADSAIPTQPEGLNRSSGGSADTFRFAIEAFALLRFMFPGSDRPAPCLDWSDLKMHRAHVLALAECRYLSIERGEPCPVRPECERVERVFILSRIGSAALHGMRDAGPVIMARAVAMIRAAHPHPTERGGVEPLKIILSTAGSMFSVLEDEFGETIRPAVCIGNGGPEDDTRGFAGAIGD